MNFKSQKWLSGLQRAALIAVGLFVAANTSSGIGYDSYHTMALVVAVLTLFAVVLKPLFVFLTLPFVVFSFGLGLWVINAALLMLAAKIISGFTVASFGSALWGAFVISFLSFAIPLLVRRRKKTDFVIETQVASVQESVAERYKKAEDSVIDI